MRGLGLLSMTFLVACTYGSASVPDPNDPGSSSASSPSASAPSSSSGSEGPLAPQGSGPFVSVHVRAVQTPVPHDASSSGQTPSLQRMAFKSLTLYTSKDDPNGYVVYDLGDSAVEAGLDDGDDTVLVKLAIASLRAGHYTYARAGVSYLRYDVASTLHASGFSIPGKFQNVQVLADGTMIDGQRRQKGYYRYTFVSSQLPPQTVEGADAPTPLTTGQGGISLEPGTDALVYGFPVDLTIDLGVTHDLNAIFELNTHENFRWRDLETPGYAKGVYDTTPTSFEPVTSFGANSARLYWEQ